MVNFFKPGISYTVSISSLNHQGAKFPGTLLHCQEQVEKNSVPGHCISLVMHYETTYYIN